WQSSPAWRRRPARSLPLSTWRWPPASLLRSVRLAAVPGQKRRSSRQVPLGTSRRDYRGLPETPWWETWQGGRAVGNAVVVSKSPPAASRPSAAAPSLGSQGQRGRNGTLYVLRVCEERMKGPRSAESQVRGGPN